MKKSVSKEELIERINYMLENTEYSKVKYFYLLIGYTMGFLNKSEREV